MARTIKGYGAVFNEATTLQDGSGRSFNEYIRPGAFTKSLKKIKDVRALFNHDPNYLLGRTTSGTLRVQEDERGLAYEIDLPETRNDIYESIKRGDIDGSSFTFLPIKDQWHDIDGVPTRELVEVELYEVGPVAFPAYSQTSVDLRSISLKPKPNLYKFYCSLLRQKL